MLIDVEVRSEAEADEAIENGADIVMLDNLEGKSWCEPGSVNKNVSCHFAFRGGVILGRTKLTTEVGREKEVPYRNKRGN